jgi:hypothetical protein
MPDEEPKPEFVPFVPRRWPARPPGEVDIAAAHAEPARQDDEPPGSGSAATIVAEQAEAVVEPWAAPEDREPEEIPAPPSPEPKRCDHGSMIRDEAIHLAIIACGRALRRTALVHPALVAAFVEDALAAAGSPKDARVVYDEGDADLPKIRVLCPDAHLWGDVETRAELLVRAAAET